MPSRVSRLTNLHMIAFGPFLAFRAGTQWAMSISLIEILQHIASKMQEKRNRVSRRVCRRLFGSSAITGTPSGCLT